MESVSNCLVVRNNMAKLMAYGHFRSAPSIRHFVSVYFLLVLSRKVSSTPISREQVLYEGRGVKDE